MQGLPGTDRDALRHDSIARVAPLAQKKRTRLGASALEAPPGIGPGIKVLQTSALPLGYGALDRLRTHNVRP